MDISPVMSRFGFGHRSTRHIIIDHDGELWLAMAPVALGGFLPMGATSLPGTLRVEPLEDGKPAAFSYTATESLLELTTAAGAKVQFAIDKDAQAIRIKGDAAFRLNGVEASNRVTTLNTPEGVRIHSGANNYFVIAKKGAITFDDTWILNEFRSVTPVIDVEPEGGEFELVAYDMPSGNEAPAIKKTLEECVKENGAAFDEFLGTLVDVPDEWRDVRQSIAYPLWLCHRFLTEKTEVIVENKYNSKNTGAMLMAIASMAFRDARRAVEMLLSYPVESPPVAGVAAARLLDEGLLNDSRGEIYKVYSALETYARGCMKNRATDKDGLAYYAYRFESGEGVSPEFFSVGEPVFAPDLNAYLIIVCEVAGKLAKMEHDAAIAPKWEAHAKSLTAKLIAELWDGEDFIGKNAYTGEASGPDAYLSPTPIILGSRLPAEIIEKIAPKISAQVCDSAVGFLLAAGLFDAGKKTEARDIALEALSALRSDGVDCPFYGASLLALAHKVL